MRSVGLICGLLLTLAATSVDAHTPRGAATGAVSGLFLPAVNDLSATNWKNAGLLASGGIPTRSTQCGVTVAMSGLIPPATNDDTDKINAAIAACTAGQVVQLALSTNTAATVSISGNALTCTVCTGIAIGTGVSGTNIQAGTTVTAGSGTSWTVSFAPAPGTTVTAQSVRIYTQYNVSTTKFIALNKGVTIRGGDACTSQTQTPFCGTVINVYDGALPDWSISSGTGGTNCGVTTATHVTCSAGTGVILVSPSGNFNWSWSGDNFGSTPTHGTLLAADIAQGATTVQVASTTGFTAGTTWALIDENPQVVSTVNPTGGANVLASIDWLTASASPATMRLEGGDLATSYSLNPNRVNEELHLVTAVGPGPCPGTSCTLTFDDPVTLAFRQSGSHDARVYFPALQSVTTANPFVTLAGVENITFTRAANTAIAEVFTANSWVRNVEVAGWINGAVNANYAVRLQIEFNYFHDCYDCENNGVEYPVGISQASTENYLVNNIIVRGGKGMVGRAAGANIVAYNYVDMTMYQQSSIGDYWVDMGVNGSHYAGAHHWLFEGNWGDNCDSDETHGNAIYHTFFRNDCTGIRTTFLDISNTALTVNDTAGTGFATSGAPNGTGIRRAAGPMAFDYWFAFAGNVLGTAGTTTTGNGWVYRCAPPTNGSNKCIWASGWVGAEWPAADPNLNTNTNPWIFRNDNYDYVSAGIADNAAGYSQALPNSLYLPSGGSAKPAFFSAGTCVYPWPWVTPTSSPFVQPNSCSGSGIPAKARFDAGTPFVQP